MENPQVLCLGHSDPSAVSGIEADLTAVRALNCEPLTVATAVSMQNDRGEADIKGLSAELVSGQIEKALENGKPMAVKIGVLASVEVIDAVGDFLDSHAKQNIPVVVEPVIRVRGYAFKLEKSAQDALKRRILIRSSLLLSTVEGAEALTGLTIRDMPEVEHAAEMLMTLGARAVLVVNAVDDQAFRNDVLVDEAGHVVYPAFNFADCGCPGAENMFSASVAAHMAMGLGARRSCEQARNNFLYAL